MAVKADLSKAMAEDLIVVMGTVGCQKDELRGDLQKLEAPKLQDIIKLGEAFERTTSAKKGLHREESQSQQRKPDNPARRREIDKLMKDKCFRCGEGHLTDQCSQKGNTLKCTSCNRKGHLAKACYSTMLKGAVKFKHSFC